MITADRNGIICDFCGMSYVDQFNYYSINTIEYSVIKNQKMNGKKDLDADMCESCYEELLKGVKDNLAPVKKGHIKCDLSKTFKTGTFVYYVMIFDRVSVDKNQQEESQVSVSNNVMDLNIINGMDQLRKRTEVIKKKIKSDGAWT